MVSKLTLFDLDNTLLGGDSDHAWGEFLIDQGLVEAAAHRAENDRHYAQYQAGKLDIDAYVEFTLRPILQLDPAERDTLHHKFMQHHVLPMVLPKARSLVNRHLDAGDCCVIITATNRFITEPIAAEFGVPYMLATDLEQREGFFTGKIAGFPCYQDGKVARIQQWLDAQDENLELTTASFYSDSINDLPLLQAVGNPVVVDPDTALAQKAEQFEWPVMSLR